MNNLIQRHIPPESINKVSIAFSEAGQLFAYIVSAIEDVESSIRAKSMCEDFGGDWPCKQAHYMGQLKALDFCKQLISR